MYVAEVQSMDTYGNRYVTRVEDARHDTFYAKVTGTVAGITRGGHAVVALETSKEGE